MTVHLLPGTTKATTDPSPDIVRLRAENRDLEIRLNEALQNVMALRAIVEGLQTELAQRGHRRMG